jgi:PAS domain S-box-containing protein
VGRFNVLTDPFSTVTGMVDFFRRAYAGEIVQTPEFSINLQLAAIDWGTSGKRIRFRMVLVPQRDAAGEVQRVLAVMFEVTQHHLAQRVAERLLEATRDDDAAEHIVHELRGELDIVRARVWRVAGNGRGELVLAAHQSLPPEPGDEPPGEVPTDFAHRAWETARTQVWQRRGPITERTATSIHALVTAPITLPHGVIGVIEVGTSSRYLATQALPTMVERIADVYEEYFTRTRAQRRFEALFERSPDPTLVIDQHGAVLSANERAQALLGAKPASLAAVFADFTALDARHAAVFADDAPATGTSVWIEQTAVDADGTAISVEVAVSPLDADLHAGTKNAVLVLRDLRERLRLESELRQSLEEKSTLLQEVHHRVKNNLQIVLSLVSLQADRLGDLAARQALLCCSDRIRAMSLVHQLLYGGEELESIRLDDYARSLVQHLCSSLAPGCTTTFHLAPVQISLDEAVPCGLILNEFVTNAIKHGGGFEGACDIEVGLQPHTDGFDLWVCDAGPGFTLPASRGSLGLQLIQGLTRQLGARFSNSVRSESARATVRLSLRRRPSSSVVPTG